MEEVSNIVRELLPKIMENYNEEDVIGLMDELAKQLKNCTADEGITLYCAITLMKGVIKDSLQSSALTTEHLDDAKGSYTERQAVRAANLNIIQKLVEVRLGEFARAEGTTLEVWIKREYSKRKDDPAWKKRVRKAMKTL